MAAPAIGAGPSPGAGAARVILSGPTGGRDGVPVADPDAPPDPATLGPLDTYGRAPGLAISRAGGDGDGWMSWEVTAVPSEAAGDPPMTLVAGIAEVPIPLIEVPAPDPGDWLVLATLSAREPEATGTWAWRLVVPDRTLPEAIPVPEAVLSAGGHSVLAERGSSCYLGSCGDVGGYPPDDRLPHLRSARTDEPVTLALSDGSGFTRASVLATSLGAPGGDGPILIWDGPPTHGGDALQVPSPGPGTWRLELSVVFDDGRGDATYLAVVEVP